MLPQHDVTYGSALQYTAAHASLPVGHVMIYDEDSEDLRPLPRIQRHL